MHGRNIFSSFFDLQVTQIDNSLPRTYMVEACQKVVDHSTATKVERTPGEQPGAELPLKPLLEAQIRNYVS